MIKLISDLPAHVTGFEVSGIVSSHDYETVIMPTIEEAVHGHKISLLYHINADFEKFELVRCGRTQNWDCPIWLHGKKSHWSLISSGSRRRSEFSGLHYQDR